MCTNDREKSKEQLLDEIAALRAHLNVLKSGLVRCPGSSLKENELQTSESQRTMFSCSSPAVVISDKESGRILSVNGAATLLYGFDRDELLSMAYADLFTEAHPDADFGAGLQGTGQSAIQTRCVRKGDGSEFPVEISAVTIDTGRFSAVCWVIQAITSAGQSADVVRESENMMRSIFRAAPIGIGVVSNRILLDVNERICEITGYSRDELVGKNARILYPTDEDYEFVGREKYRQIRDFGTGTVETRFVRKDGRIIDVLLSSTPLDPSDLQAGVTFTALDITEQRRAESALRGSEHKHRVFLENFDGIAYQASALTFRPFLFSGRVKGITGYSSDDFTSGRMSWDQLIHPDDKERIRDTGKALLERDGFVADEEYRIISRDGRIRWVRDIARIICPEDSDSDFIQGAVYDVTERRLAEEALRESEKRFKLAMEANRDGLWDWNVITDEVYYSPACATMLGYTSSELLPRIDSWNNLIHADDKEAVYLASKGCIENECDTFEVEFRMRAKSGDWRWLHGRCRAVARDSNGRASRIIGTQTDITERKLVMEALRDSEARFRGTFEQAAVGVAQVSPEGKFLRINQRFCDFLGYSRDEMLNREFQDVTYPDDLNSSIEIVSRLIDEELERYSTEKRYCRKDGSVVWGNLTVSLVRKSDNSPDYFISVVQDISERKRAEEALTESENRYRELFNSVLEGIGIVDEFDMVRYVNPALVTIFGENSADVMLGKNLLEYFTESQRQIIRKEIDHGRCGLGSQCEVELQLSNGIKKFLLVSTKPRFDRERNYAGAFITFLNITETKRLKQLESRAERLELAGTIAGQVAHDLNNLLAPLVAYPELIRDELPPDHEVLAYLDDIEDAAKKIADINQDLLTMGRRGHYNQEVLDLNRIVNRAVQEIRPQTTADLKTLLRDDLSRIKGGATQIYRVITNLIVNALDALHDGGKVFIETENFIADSTSVSFGKIPKGEYVRLTIADTGCGIPDDIIQKIFDPFFSTKTNERKRGSGLGLSIVDAVMKDHGGYIDLRTTVGRGTTFYLYFPVTRESLERTESDPPLGSGETILVVDDERIQREVSTELLTRLGYFVSSVESGEVAIEFLRGNPQDLVILDMVMPRGLDGVETFRQMLKLSPHQKAIILSGYSEMDRVAEIRKLGVGAYIRKPVSRRELAFAVRRELDRHAEKVPS